MKVELTESQIDEILDNIKWNQYYHGGANSKYRNDPDLVVAQSAIESLREATNRRNDIKNTLYNARDRLRETRRLEEERIKQIVKESLEHFQQQFDKFIKKQQEQNLRLKEKLEHKADKRSRKKKDKTSPSPLLTQKL